MIFLSMVFMLVKDLGHGVLQEWGLHLPQTLWEPLFALSFLPQVGTKYHAWEEKKIKARFLVSVTPTQHNWGESLFTLHGKYNQRFSNGYLKTGHYA